MTTPLPQVSVVVPTFNRREVLPRALDSILGQTFGAFELIVVDDGSTDGTAELVERSYPDIHFLRQENRGVSAARNAGIATAQGEWIAFLDSDDAWLPEKLERQMQALEREPVHRFCHTDEIWIRDGQRVNPASKYAKSGGWAYHSCLPHCVISPSSVLMHRDLLRETGNFDESLEVCEDYDLWLRVTARDPVLFLDEQLLFKYGGHQDQLSTKHWGMDRYRIKALQRVLEDGLVSGKDERMTRQTLVDKLEILVEGSRKRGNDALLQELEPQLAQAKAILASPLS
ncbi:MAG: glycosyl transferase [Opitutae bacterium]|nr:glycosyl transferase [Opitutae bacterium]|tara:strand:+ start:175 stop:1032 length:858 start_codon:yes stop_codon:yes gene_type:complete